jgi:type VI secretion system protein ImpM
MTKTQAAAAVGFYGKLPCRGDFLRRRVPQEFVDAWDPWVQECISESWHQLEERWLESYLTSPVWRFVLADGVCGTGAYAGVMLPSVDRVGRYFPLTIVARWNVDDSLVDAACLQQRWFEAAEALAVQALDAETLDLDDFDADVARLATQIDVSGASESAFLRNVIQHSEFPHRLAQWHVPLAAADSLQRAINVLALRELERTLRPLSIWWTDGSNEVDPGMLCGRGLPDARSFAAMMSGEWVSYGWSSLDPNRNERVKPRVNGRAQPAQHSAAEAAGDSLFAPLPLQITACHEPQVREAGADASGAHFVLRPDLGLWGVATSDAARTEYTAAQAIADVLQSVPQAGSLTALVEEVRRAIDGAKEQLARATLPGIEDEPVGTQAIVFLARGDECALVCSGDVQAMRCRSAAVTPIIGVASFADSAYSSGTTRAPALGSLMDLLAAPIEKAVNVNEGNGPPATRAPNAHETLVRYESLRAGDSWVIAGAPIFEEPQLPAVAAALADSGAQPAPALTALRTACSTHAVDTGGTFPVLLLCAARPTVEA